MPFVTEYIHLLLLTNHSDQQLRDLLLTSISGSNSIIRSGWPSDNLPVDQDAIAKAHFIEGVVKIVRRSRAERPTRSSTHDAMFFLDSAPSSWVDVRNLLSVVLRVPTRCIKFGGQAGAAAKGFWWTNSEGTVQETKIDYVCKEANASKD
eukprot:GHVS01020612.1.p1 GENE.GHVS01020612.1~~GHVS01020612.1.p1  ORF type:complete len:150 (+),score=8.05 GHVS01020612.1:106-555(+)